MHAWDHYHANLLRRLQPFEIYNQPVPDDLELWEIEEYERSFDFWPWSPLQKIPLEEVERRAAFKLKYQKCWTPNREEYEFYKKAGKEVDLRWLEELRRKRVLRMSHAVPVIPPPDEMWD
jgi:hypothetical protein